MRKPVLNLLGVEGRAFYRRGRHVGDEGIVCEYTEIKLLEQGDPSKILLSGAGYATASLLGPIAPSPDISEELIHILWLRPAVPTEWILRACRVNSAIVSPKQKNTKRPRRV